MRKNNDSVRSAAVDGVDGAIASAKAIAGAMQLPGNVEPAIRFLASRGLWFVLTKNMAAYSCPDAARKRVRVGAVGIGLHEELKSSLEYAFVRGEKLYVAIHCRGDQERVPEKIRDVVGAEKNLEKVDSSEVERLGLGYGLINPFVESLGGASLIHVFDDSVLELKSSATMFTNAGARTWGVEFRPKELVESYGDGKSRVASICRSPSEGVALGPAPAIGIITGNGPESGIALWRRVNRSVLAYLRSRDNGCPDVQEPGDISLPEVIICSSPGMGLSMELDQRAEEVWAVIEGGARRLARQGVKILALACHTTHFFEEELKGLEKDLSVRFVSMVEATKDFIDAQDLESVAVVGVRYVAGFGNWSAYRRLLDTRCEIETIAESTAEELHGLAFRVKSAELSRYIGLYDRMVKLLERNIRSDNVLLALTELSQLLDYAKPKQRARAKKNLIDPLEIYADAIARAYMDLLPFVPPRDEETKTQEAAAS